MYDCIMHRIDVCALYCPRGVTCRTASGKDLHAEQNANRSIEWASFDLLPLSVYALPAQNTPNYATNTIVRPTAHEFSLQRDLSPEAPHGEVAVLYTAKAVSYLCKVRSTPLPITAELQIEYREFPGPISGANPTFTSLEPEDPGRGAPTRLLGKRASRGNTAQDPLSRRDKSNGVEISNGNLTSISTVHATPS